MTQPIEPTSQEAPDAVPLYNRVSGRQSVWEKLLSWWPWLLLASVLLAFGWLFVKPAPPDKVVIAAGPKDGAYYWFAQRYAETFAADGVTLELKETLGSVENYQHLDADTNSAKPWETEGGVSTAIVQSGTCPEGIRSDLQAVASLYLEPIWIFYRGEKGTQLTDLAGKLVAVGPEGSGSRSISQRLLSANGIKWEDRTDRPATAPTTRPGTGPTTRPVEPIYTSTLGGRTAAEALKAGKVDAIVLVFSPRYPLIAELLKDPSIRLMSFDRHEAYARIYPFLSDVKLPRGTVNLAADLPREDTYLLAPAANLVCRDGLHPAIVALLIKAAVKAHERGDLLSPPGKLPSTQFVEFPIDPAAAEYFRSGPPFLQRYLPFWAAALVDRMKILLLPLITLIIPLARVAPPLFVWRTRSKIYRWYRVLKEIDRRLREDTQSGANADPSRFDGDINTLIEVEKELANQKVPLAYMEEFYNLRLHTDFLRRKLERHVGRDERREAERK